MNEKATISTAIPPALYIKLLLSLVSLVGILLYALFPYVLEDLVNKELEKHVDKGALKEVIINDIKNKFDLAGSKDFILSLKKLDKSISDQDNSLNTQKADLTLMKEELYELKEKYEETSNEIVRLQQEIKADRKLITKKLQSNKVFCSEMRNENQSYISDLFMLADDQYRKLLNRANEIGICNES